MERPVPEYEIPAFSIGKDSTLCPGQSLTLKVPQFCGATYKWSNGSTERSIDVTFAGTYWVDVTMYGKIKRDEVLVSMHDPIMVELGADKIICPGVEVSWVLPLIDKATYVWSNGIKTNTNTATQPGLYWVEVSNRCETVRDEVTMSKAVSPSVNLGHDIVACAGEAVELSYTPTVGETLLWSDGSMESTLLVRNSGVYKLIVNNGCTQTTDEIEVTIKGSDDMFIPNIVTSNGDGKNDTFLLPENIEGASVMICNRWGERIFFSSRYVNNWPMQDVSAGVYFYTVQDECRKKWKGTLKVVEGED